MARSRGQSGAKAIFMQLGGTAPIGTSTGTSGSGIGLPTTVSYSGTARTASASDNNTIIEFTNSSPATYTIEAYSVTPIPVGAILYALQGDAGQVTFVPGTGVTFETPDSYKTRAQEAIIAMKHVSMDKWQAMGDLEISVTGNCVVGRAAGSTGPTSIITCSNNGYFLTRRSGTLQFDAIAQADVTNLVADLSTITASIATKETITNVQNGASVFAAGAGTADAITATLTPAPTLTDGMEIRIRATGANTVTNPTLALNGGTAYTIYKLGGQALAVGDIYGAGHEMLLRWRNSATRWELLNPAPSGFTGDAGDVPITDTGTYYTGTEVETALQEVGASLANKQPSIQFKDEGTNAGGAGAVTTVDFVGAGVNAAYSGGTLTVTISGGGGGSLSDGDYGDITVSGGVTVMTVDAGAITYAKMQDVSTTQRVLGRNTAGAGDVEEVSLSQLLDWIGSATQGDILYRGASGWSRLAAGTSGHFLKTQGAGADPTWAAASGGTGVDYTNLPYTTTAIGIRGMWGMYAININTTGATLTNINSGAYGQSISSGGAITVASTNSFTRQPRYRYSSAATAGSSAANYSNAAFCWGAGGYFYMARFGNADAATVANARCFYGLSAGLASPGNVNPSSMVNILGFGADTGDTNMQFLYNDGSGTASKVDLGANFPANSASTDFYEIQILQTPNSGTVKYWIINLANNATASGSVSTDIPSSTTGLGRLDWRNNGTTALAVSYHFGAFTIAYNLDGF